MEERHAVADLLPCAWEQSDELDLTQRALMKRKLDVLSISLFDRLWNANACPLHLTQLAIWCRHLSKGIYSILVRKESLLLWMANTSSYIIWWSDFSVRAKHKTASSSGEAISTNQQPLIVCLRRSLGLTNWLGNVTDMQICTSLPSIQICLYIVQHTYNPLPNKAKFIYMTWNRHKCTHNNK